MPRHNFLRFGLIRSLRLLQCLCPSTSMWCTAWAWTINESWSVSILTMRVAYIVTHNHDFSKLCAHLILPWNQRWNSCPTGSITWHNNEPLRASLQSLSSMLPKFRWNISNVTFDRFQRALMFLVDGKFQKLETTHGMQDWRWSITCESTGKAPSVSVTHTQDFFLLLKPLERFQRALMLVEVEISETGEGTWNARMTIDQSHVITWHRSITCHHMA